MNVKMSPYELNKVLDNFKNFLMNAEVVYEEDGKELCKPFLSGFSITEKELIINFNPDVMKRIEELREESEG